jgi:hypothetical protein
MLHLDLYAADELMETVVAERLAEAEGHRLLRQAQAGRRGRLYRQGACLLAQVGRLLVALGRRLEQVGSAQPVSLEPAEMLGLE